MKTKTLCLFCFLIYLSLCPSFSIAQQGWHILQKADWECFFESIFFLPDGQNGWAVGSKGMIIHTTDGGTIWNSQISGTSEWLYSVYFIDVNIGWAVGRSGIVIHTTDGGTTWTHQISESSTLFSIYFINADTGWAVGANGKVIHTTNGGTSWSSQNSGTNKPLNSIYFTDAENGWAVGGEWNYGIIIYTSNGGKTWTSQTNSLNKYLSGIFFINKNTGWAVGQHGRIMYTSNGGNSWNYQTSGVYSHLKSVCFANETTGWIVGQYGIILHTSNGGVSWSSQNSGIGIDLQNVFFVDFQIGWAVGGGRILHTFNGGATWTSQTNWTSDELNSVYFIDSKYGWIAGNHGTIYRTINGGESWESQVSNTPNDLESVCFTDINNGWIVGEYGTVIHTTNGGETWTKQSSGTNNGLWGVHFINSTTGWIAGHHDLILHTKNGGNTWTTQEYNDHVTLKDVFFIDSNNGWAVGYNNYIFHSNNGGNTWKLQGSGISEWSYLEDVYFADKKFGWAVGGKGATHTINGGVTWTQQTSAGSNLSSVFFIDKNLGWAVGDNGKVIRTANGGTTWITETSKTDHRLYSVCFSDDSTGWAVGEWGIVIKYTLPGLIVGDDVLPPSIGMPFGFLLYDGNKFVDWKFKLINYGSSSITINGYESSNLTFYIISPKFPQSLSPQEEIDMTIRFDPRKTGLYQDSLSFYITGQDTSIVYEVKLSGGALLTQNPLVRLLYSRAVVAYDSAKAYNPYSSAVHNNLGVIFFILNATNQASSEFERSYGKGVEMNKGSILAMQNDYQQSLSTWTNLLGDVYTPYYIKPQLKFNMGWVYDEIDSLEEAYLYYSDVIIDSLANNRLRAKAYLGRGVTVYKLASGDTTAAYQDFRQAISLDPYGAGVIAQKNILKIIDQTAPSSVSDLSFSIASDSSITLLWTAPGDDQMTGMASYYDIRFNTFSADTNLSTWWAEAYRVLNEPQPSFAGSQDSFTVTNLLPGTFYYFAMKVGDEAENWSEISNIVEVATLPTGVTIENKLPRKYDLSQNYPNPFNPSTIIRYELPQISCMKIKVYDILGREIITLVDAKKMPGCYETKWNGENSSGNRVASGIYIYHIEAEHFRKSKKMILLR